MIEEIINLPPHVRMRLASALETGVLAMPPTPDALTAIVGEDVSAAVVAQAFGHLVRVGVGALAAAAWLRSLDRVAARLSRPDLVWSGPEAAGLRARDTRQVYPQLLGSAQCSLWACTYAFFDGPRAFEVLARRMDAVPALRAVLLLNIQRGRGDSTPADQLVRRFADRFWGMDWPGTRRPEIYYDPRALDLDGRSSVLHAKAVVADGESVFVTSANLTEAAFDRNIELGLLVRDKALAGSIVAHFQGLIDRELLAPLPAA